MKLAADETLLSILETVRRFTERELLEGVGERDTYPYAEFARDSFARLAETGLLLLGAGEDLGGVGLPAAAWALVLEKIAETDAGFAASLLAHALATQALLKWGTEKLQREWLTRTPAPLLAYPLYLEADDLQDLPQVQAENGRLLLSGQARLVANSPVATAGVVVAELEGEPALILAPLEENSRPAPMEMLGLRACPVGDWDFADLSVPQENLLVRGQQAVAELHAEFYPAVTALLLATLKSSLDYAIEYGRERYQGGQMISEHSQLRKMYGQMAVEHGVLREAWLRVVEGEAAAGAALALKVLAGELAVRATMDGVQLLGGYGYTEDYPQERRMRDARQAAEILGSPARQQLSLVDRMMGEG